MTADILVNFNTRSSSWYFFTKRQPGCQRTTDGQKTEQYWCTTEHACLHWLSV